MLKIDNIKNKYGSFSSWAIWNYNDIEDINIIDLNKSLLHNNYVLIGLNISKATTIWGNFHKKGSHDRKLMYAFNSFTIIKGAYMTDLIKYAEVNSKNIVEKIKNKEIDIDKSVTEFVTELRELEISSKTKFIIFGDSAREIYNRYYEKHFSENKVYFFKHYSARGTDKEWVEEIWKRLNIKLDFEQELKKYKN